MGARPDTLSKKRLIQGYIPGSVAEMSQWSACFCISCKATLQATFTGLLFVALTGCGDNTSKPASKASPEVTFKPQEMADALHAVIAADREVYSRHVLQRLAGDEKLIKTSENWEQDKALPVPEQVLRLGSEAVQQKGAEFHYVLRSLWPINARNAPETPTERAGLQAVVDHPDTNFYAEESLGGRRYFTAVYPDRATVPSCTECHNSHERNGKRDFRPGDVIGGMIVRVPLEF
jgi:hypothetical protein